MEKNGYLKREKKGEDRWLILQFSVTSGNKKDSNWSPQAPKTPKTTTFSEKSQSMYLRVREIYNISHDYRYIILKTCNKKCVTLETSLKTSEIHSYESKNPKKGNKKKETKKRADRRFKVLIDRIFEIYESETGTKLNPVFDITDGAMVKRLLKKLPEESVDRLCESFLFFLRTNNEFDADQIKRKPIRYWATRINVFLQKKQFDVSEGYRRKHGTLKND